MQESIKPNKNLGQNFLKNKYTINTIIDILNISKSDHIVEIGPGQGAITDQIIKKTKNYIGIEKDRNLCEILKKNHKDNINIKCADILNVDFSNIYKEKYRVIGNIPYNISTKLLMKCIKNRNYIKDINFMMQKEFIDRIVSMHGSKSFGRLSVITQIFFETQKYIDIEPKDFFPEPKVFSSFVVLKPLNKILLEEDEIENFLKFIKIIFNTRRKKIKNCLNNISKKYDNIDRRAEELSIINLIKLYREINSDGEFI